MINLIFFTFFFSDEDWHPQQFGNEADQDDIADDEWDKLFDNLI